jgi:hypothetical protein
VAPRCDWKSACYKAIAWPALLHYHLRAISNTFGTRAYAYACS